MHSAKLLWALNLIFSVIILVSCGCVTNYHKFVRLNNRNLSSQHLETKNPKPRCGQGTDLLEGYRGEFFPDPSILQWIRTFFGLWLQKFQPLPPSTQSIVLFLFLCVFTSSIIYEDVLLNLTWRLIRPTRINTEKLSFSS